MTIKFFDMFAGIGGFRSGLEAIGGFECVGYCEIDKYAKQAYEAMYDTGGELYFEDARKIIPRLLSHNKGRTFKTILSSLDQLGYDVVWQVLNSKNFGVPQSRKRLYLIGFHRENVPDKYYLSRRQILKLLYKDTQAKKVTAYIPRKEPVLH